jgi:hypothetical protein
MHHYIVGLGNGVPTYELPNFEKKIKSVLDDDRGWKKFGYSFSKSNDTKNWKKSEHNFYIYLSTEEEIKKKCNFQGMSCYDPHKKTIRINYVNWYSCGKSTLPVDRYRTYAINHEVGHHLGFDHVKAKKVAKYSTYTSVMIQLTRGKDVVENLIENEWPLDEEFEIAGIENANIKNAGIKGGKEKEKFLNFPNISNVSNVLENKYKNIFLFLFLIIFVCVIILFAYFKHRQGKFYKFINL